MMRVLRDFSCHTLVLVSGGVVPEVQPTSVAPQRLLASVDTKMRLELALLGEPPATLAALVRLLASVHPLVDVAPLTCREPLFAVLATEPCK